MQVFRWHRWKSHLMTLLEFISAPFPALLPDHTSLTRWHCWMELIFSWPSTCATRHNSDSNSIKPNFTFIIICGFPEVIQLWMLSQFLRCFLPTWQQQMKASDALQREMNRCIPRLLFFSCLVTTCEFSCCLQKPFKKCKTKLRWKHQMHSNVKSPDAFQDYWEFSHSLQKTFQRK